MTKRVLLLISDTGGGHRSAANAVVAALDEVRFGPNGESLRLEHRIDDVAAHCTFPLSQLGPAYSAALRFAPPIYGALYHATNGRRRFRSFRGQIVLLNPGDQYQRQQASRQNLAHPQP